MPMRELPMPQPIKSYPAVPTILKLLGKAKKGLFAARRIVGWCCRLIIVICTWNLLIKLERYAVQSVVVLFRKLKKRFQPLKTARHFFELMPKEARLLLVLPGTAFGLIVLVLAISMLLTFIRPASAAFGQYGISEDEYGDARAYYCKYLASTAKSGSRPMLCQAPSMIAAAIAPFILVTHYDGDKYDWGNCTYWAAYRREQAGKPVPNTWGDAYNWADRAASDGYTVDHTPTPGSVMQTNRGIGHVAYVESVNPDGSWRISEMNVIGFNEVDYRLMPAAAASSYYFIH